MKGKEILILSVLFVAGAALGVFMRGYSDAKTWTTAA